MKLNHVEIVGLPESGSKIKKLYLEDRLEIRTTIPGSARKGALLAVFKAPPFGFQRWHVEELEFVYSRMANMAGVRWEY